MTTKKELTFKSLTHDGKPAGELTAFVHYKSDSSTVSKPIVLALHGGSFVVGSKDLLPAPQIEKLLDLGFVVVAPDYRLAPTISLFDGPVGDSQDAYKWASRDLPDILKKDGVAVDGQKIVVLGHSCGGTLALLTATLSPPPIAIADFFGMKYLDDPFYSQPSEALSKVPPMDKEFIDKVYEEVPAPTGAPMPFGPKGPNFDKPRNAWMFDRLKNGTLYKDLIPEGQMSRIEPSLLFEKGNFPPTVFVHGTADTLVDVKFSEKAHEALKSRGVETKLLVKDGGQHGFDAHLKREDEDFAIVAEAFEFLKRKVSP